MNTSRKGRPPSHPCKITNVTPASRITENPCNGESPKVGVEHKLELARLKCRFRAKQLCLRKAYSRNVFVEVQKACLGAPNNAIYRRVYMTITSEKQRQRGPSCIPLWQFPIAGEMSVMSPAHTQFCHMPAGAHLLHSPPEKIRTAPSRDSQESLWDQLRRRNCSTTQSLSISSL